MLLGRLGLPLERRGWVAARSWHLESSVQRGCWQPGHRGRDRGLRCGGMVSGPGGRSEGGPASNADGLCAECIREAIEQISLQAAVRRQGTVAGAGRGSVGVPGGDLGPDPNQGSGRTRCQHLDRALIVAALKPVHGKVAGTSETIQDRNPSRHERLQALKSLLHRRLRLTESPLLRRVLRSAADCADKQQRRRYRVRKM